MSNQFDYLVGGLLDRAAADARAAGRFSDAHVYEAAKDMLIDDPVAYAIETIESELELNDKLDEWLDKHITDAIADMSDTELAEHCEALLADPDIVAKYMSYNNMLAMIEENIQIHDLREIIADAEG